MFANLRQDLARLATFRGQGHGRVLIEALLFDNGFQAVVLYRLAHACKRRKIRFLGPFFCRLSIFLTGVEIAPGAAIGPGLLISHGTGIVIGQWARIGAGATLMQQVTLGAPSMGRLEQMPELGDGVFVGAGARLIGGIKVGDGALIGTNAVVTVDVPAGAKALSAAGIEIVSPALDA